MKREMNMKYSHITDRELVHDYLESYMDIARCELALLYPYSSASNNHEKLTDRLNSNKNIVGIIVRELAARKDTSLFDEREMILGVFTG